MKRENNTAVERKGKHLNKEERVVVERMSRGGIPPRDIAAVLGRTTRTIRNELKRGAVIHKDSELREKQVYSADRAQDDYDLNSTAKGPQLKIGCNHVMADFIAARIGKKKESPEVVAYRLSIKFPQQAVCAKTLYRYIDEGLIPGVTNETLWEKRKRNKHKKKKKVRRLKPLHENRLRIDMRSKEANERKVLGHWEMDLIVGPIGSSATILTLVERKTRQLITVKLKDKTQRSVLKALRKIEKFFGPLMFRKLFKSITTDNGSEFLDVTALRKSAFSKQVRTDLFYAHPYASWEKGSVENANRMLRRFIAKGHDIAKLTHQRLKEITRWINNYPRKLLDFDTAQNLFEQEFEKIAA